MGKPDATWTFHLSGGRLCFDFANTVSWRRSGAAIERLGGYRDLMAWSRQAGLVTVQETQRLLRAAARRPAEAARVLREAVLVREAIYRIFSRLADGRTPAAADLARLSDALAEALSRVRVIRREGRFELGWAVDPPRLDRPLGPVVRSAADLLTSQELGRVRKCAADNCGWVFLDTTRNRSRRWCDMRVCGNRAKVRRYRRRRRGS